jgi:hypothetical protein
MARTKTGIEMEFSQLAKLGKVGGVAGLALGAFLLLARAVITESGAVPEAWRGPIFLAVAVVAAVPAVVAVFFWGGGRGGAQVALTAGNDSPARNEDGTRSGGGQRAKTEGDRSPAENKRG